jgi:hypothetical protein
LPRAAACIVLALSIAACRSKGPDANYDEASRLYQQLYASELDEAYGDPQMDEVERMLKLVHKRSIDKPDADRLLGTIARGKAEFAKVKAERERRQQVAQAEIARVASIDLNAGLQTPDAGVRDPYGAGAPVAGINAETGGCLMPGEPFNERGTGKAGTVYRLASTPCAEKLPGFSGQAVLVVDGQIYRRIPDAEVPKQAAAAPKPAQAPPARAAAPRPAQNQSSDDKADYVTITPGAPLPEGVRLAESADGGA